MRRPFSLLIISEELKKISFYWKIYNFMVNIVVNFDILKGKHYHA